jgi:hypothetical protein
MWPLASGGIVIHEDGASNQDRFGVERQRGVSGVSGSVWADVKGRRVGVRWGVCDEVNEVKLMGFQRKSEFNVLHCIQHLARASPTLLPNCSMRYPRMAGTSLGMGSRDPGRQPWQVSVSLQVQSNPSRSSVVRWQRQRASAPRLSRVPDDIDFPAPRAPRLEGTRQPHGSQQLTGPVQRSPN